MIFPRPTAAARVLASAVALASAGALTLSTSACSLLQRRPPRTPTACPAPPGPSALEILLDRDSATARAELRTVIPATARAGEHLLVLDADTGRALGSFTAPVVTPPAAMTPAPPPEFGPGATSFQRARHAHEVTAYHAALCRERAWRAARARALVTFWAGSAVARLAGGGGTLPDARDHGLDRGLNAALADLGSLWQAGVTFGGRTALAILGYDGAPCATTKGLAASLHGVSVVATGFPASPAAQHRCVSALLGDGAARAVALTQSTSGELTRVVRAGLSGPQPA